MYVDSWSESLVLVAHVWMWITGFGDSKVWICRGYPRTMGPSLCCRAGGKQASFVLCSKLWSTEYPYGGDLHAIVDDVINCMEIVEDLKGWRLWNIPLYRWTIVYIALIWTGSGLWSGPLGFSFSCWSINFVYFGGGKRVWWMKRHPEFGWNILTITIIGVGMSGRGWARTLRQM